MIYSQGIPSTQTHGTKSHRRDGKDEKAPCKVIPGRASGQTRLVSSFLYLYFYHIGHSRSSSVTPIQMSETPSLLAFFPLFLQ